MNEHFIFLFKQLNEKINLINTLDNSSIHYQKLKFEINIALILLFDELTRSSEEIKKEIFKNFEKYPNIYADIVSASDNPNCSCRSRVSSFFDENSLEVINIFRNILEKYPQSFDFFKLLFIQISERIDRFNLQVNLDVDYPISLVGRVFSFTTDEEYFIMMQKILKKEHYYKGLNLIEKNGEIKVYFY